MLPRANACARPGRLDLTNLEQRSTGAARASLAPCSKPAALRCLRTRVLALQEVGFKSVKELEQQVEEGQKGFARPLLVFFKAK